jgi:hypothetical protein
MYILSRLQSQRQRTFAGLRRRLKAALVDIGLGVMGSPYTGSRVTRLAQRALTRLVRWGGLADA